VAEGLRVQFKVSTLKVPGTRCHHQVAIAVASFCTFKLHDGVRRAEMSIARVFGLPRWPSRCRRGADISWFVASGEEKIFHFSWSGSTKPDEPRVVWPWGGVAPLLIAVPTGVPVIYEQVAVIER